MVKHKELPRINFWRLGDVDRLFERLYSLAPPLAAGPEQHWVPDADVFETKDDIVIKMELAGVPRENVKVLLDENVIIISGVREEAFEEEKEYYHQVEVEYGAFRRVIYLPRPVAADRCRAYYRDGFLFVILPKAEQAVTIHTIVEII